MVPIPLLVFHLVHAVSSTKGFVNLTNKYNNSVSYKLTHFHPPVNFDKSNMAALNERIFRKIGSTVINGS